MGIKGRGRSGMSRDLNPACQCCSSAHLLQSEPDEASSFTNRNVGPGTYASLRLKLDAWSSAVQGGLVSCRLPDPIYPTPPLGQDMTQGRFLSLSLTGLNSEFSFS